MSSAATEAAPAQSAPPPAQGGTILTTGIPEKAPPAPGAAPSGIETAQKLAQRPEWAPEKYWKSDKNELDAEGLGKAYTNLERLLGSEKIPKPTSDDDAEGWDRWYAASGRPSKLEEYEFQRPEKLPDGLTYDEDLEGNFRKAAFANGLNKKQTSALYDQFVKHQVERYGAYQTSQTQARQEVERALQREHGQKYEGFKQSALSAISEYADPEFRQFLEQSGLGNDPRMIRFAGRVGQAMGGETRLNGKPQPTATPQDMQRTIREFEGKYRDVLFDKYHPDHDMRVKERAQLYEAAHQ